jgi:hypothetical protein
MSNECGGIVEYVKIGVQFGVKLAEVEREQPVTTHVICELCERYSGSETNDAGSG